MEITFNMQDKK